MKTHERQWVFEFFISHATGFAGMVFGIIAGILIGVYAVPDSSASERNGRWPTVRNAYMAAHPVCELCGRPAKQCHHINPVEAYPELELDPENLCALCPECHGAFAHLDRHYDSWNPLLHEEIELHRAMVKARPKTRKEAEAFVKRFGKCFAEENYQLAP